VYRDVMPPGDQISAEDLELELRRGDRVTLVDIRDPATFAAWHVTGVGAARVVNLPEEEVAADPDSASARIGADAPVRVICAQGISSQRVVPLLRPRLPDVRNVIGGMIAWSRVLTSSALELPSGTTTVQLRREARGCLSYLVASDGEAVAVDPAPDPAPYLASAAALGAGIVHVVDTHVHADHLSGARELALRASATLHLSRAAIARGLAYPVAPLADGDHIEAGRARIDVIALPGHTSDMIGLLVDGAALIGGDSLFADSVARPDLEADDEGAPDAARTLYTTLMERVGELPGTIRLLPCHYAGGRLDGPIAPTIEEVWQAVPELRLDRDAFVSSVLGDMPPRPQNYLRIIAVNLGQAPLDESAGRLEVGANNCAARKSWDSSAA
jgi:glyoxylase-like metal-dependent hydrolase (beta-lactamase superfamily II)/rhodanese-related sulfurtransferase